MNDAPKLALSDHHCCSAAREPSVPEVVGWLREQGAVEEMLPVWHADGSYGMRCLEVPEGRYLVYRLGDQ